MAIEKRAKKLIRRTIFTFLKNYQHFTTSPPTLLLLLPLSVSSLFFHARLIPSPGPLDADLPSSAFLLVCWFPTSVLILVKAKSSILQALHPFKPFSSHSSSLRKPLLQIQSFYLLLLGFFYAAHVLIKSLVPISSNALVIVLLGTIYYVIGTNTTVVFNLAFVVSDARSLSAYASIREAFSLRIRDSSTTLLLALASSTGCAAVEALFQCRVVRALSPRDTWRPLLSSCLEGILIAYLYSIIIVMDTIACFLLVDGYGSVPKPNSCALRCCSETEAARKVVEAPSSGEEIHIHL